MPRNSSILVHPFRILQFCKSLYCDVSAIALRSYLVELASDLPLRFCMLFLVVVLQVFAAVGGYCLFALRLMIASSSCFSSKSAESLTSPSTMTQESLTEYSRASFEAVERIWTSTVSLKLEVTLPTFSIKGAKLHAQDPKGKKTSIISLLFFKAKHQQ